MKPQIIREEQHQPRPGDYYERVTAPKPGGYHDIPQGELVVITKISGDYIHHQCGEWEHGWQEEEFLAHYKYAPDGADRRDSELRDLTAETRRFVEAANQIEERGDVLGLAPLTEAFERPALTAGVEDEDEEQVVQPVDESTALVLQHTDECGVKAATLKKDITQKRNNILKFNKAVQLRMGRIKALRKEQEAAFEAALQLRKHIAVAEEVIHTINVYLGRGEQVVQIMEGEPAPKGQKIVVRQRTLYADEETAMDARSGGLDFAELRKFDDWLCTPGNLYQVLPETKGIVAIKPRRESKDYGMKQHGAAGMFAQAYFDAANAKTYFLIRNGGNLYRVVTDLEVGETIFPTRNEFEEYFNDKWEEGKTLRPGSQEFAEALDRANDNQRNYGRVLLFMQGLIDRSEIFHPLAGDEVNLMSRKESESHIQYVYDAEMLLPSGREPFWKWLEELNETLEVGHRVIGIFSGYGSRSLRDSDTGKHERIFPSGAKAPEDLILYTIEGRDESDKDAFKIYYKRDEVIYDPDMWTETRPGWGYRGGKREPKMRASIKIYKDDRFILNFDDASVEDMEFYLQSRVDRHEYISMFPLLETALEFKQLEAEQEAPFRQLLIGQFMMVHGATAEDAEARVDGLIKWWKFKNRTHRALLSDDAKAIEMIVAEYKRLSSAEGDLTTLNHRLAALVADLKARPVPPIYVGYRGNREAVALFPENDGNVFVKVALEFLKNDGTVNEYEVRDWRTVEGLKLGTELYSTERWAEWNREARREQFLTDPEISELSEQIWPDVLKRWTNSGRHQRHEGSTYAPLALVYCKTEQTFVAYFWANNGKLNATVNQRIKSAGNAFTAPGLGTFTYKWKRDLTRKVELVYESDGWNPCKEYDKLEMPWKVGPQRSRRTEDMEESVYVLMEEFPDNVAPFVKKIEKFVRKRDKVAGQHKEICRAQHAMEEKMRRVRDAAIYQRYLDEGGDPELWEDEKRGLVPERRPDADGFGSALEHLIYRGVSVKGLTVAQVLEQAKPFQAELYPLDEWKRENKIWSRVEADERERLAPFMDDIAMPEPEPEEPEEEESEEGE